MIQYFRDVHYLPQSSTCHNLQRWNPILLRAGTSCGKGIMRPLFLFARNFHGVYNWVCVAHLRPCHQVVEILMLNFFRPLKAASLLTIRNVHFLSRDGCIEPASQNTAVPCRHIHARSAIENAFLTIFPVLIVLKNIDTLF